MNNTNRAMNRILLALSGLALLATGTLAAAAGLVPDIRAVWSSAANALLEKWRSLAATAPAPEPVGTWWALAVPVLMLLGAAASIFWLARQGGGRTGVAAQEDDGGQGTTAVDVSFLAAAVQEAVKGNRAVAGSSLTAWRRSKGSTTGALRLTLQARKGASPRELADLAEELVAGIDALLGHRTTVLVRIADGTRTRLAGAHRAG
jgi:hypothetical protein